MWVYFIVGGGMTKVGLSADPRKRLQQLQASSPVKLTLVHCRRGQADLERAVHYVMRDRREHGEWFKGAVDEREACAICARTGYVLENFTLPSRAGRARGEQPRPKRKRQRRARSAETRERDRQKALAYWSSVAAAREHAKRVGRPFHDVVDEWKSQGRSLLTGELLDDPAVL